MIRIAVDGMGGDFAPLEIVKGAQSVSRDGLASIVLVGDVEKMKPYLTDNVNLDMVHTSICVEMHESPSNALRKKRDSSMNLAFELHKRGEVDAVVSAGNSGAAMAFAIFTLGRVSGVDRPAIATLHPRIGEGLSILLDAGGNVDCKPVHFVQFALMGNAFAASVLGIDSPRVGILSNGEEETKGNELTREAHALIKELRLNYLGYVEGTDMYNGRTDVVVSDGFVGNIALKISEGVAELIYAFFKDGIQKSLKAKIGYLLLKDLFKDFQKKADYSETGGAPLLGVDGVSIICHGKSNEKAIRNAILLAKTFVEKGLKESVSETMRDYQSMQRLKER
ncbi:MAG: phosphate acyltransferase PlsX [Syntrophorhabdaceae bacterium]|nr:phosphate acyltransferase PlsX [Syntrophorhabdaceae bacterium]MDD4196518.1 phosphate acyltransferase PlsX [Syntrophorhabdaceae bacterium]